MSRPAHSRVAGDGRPGSRRFGRAGWLASDPDSLVRSMILSVVATESRIRCAS
jgi:hypothetical protein